MAIEAPCITHLMKLMKELADKYPYISASSVSVPLVREINLRFLAFQTRYRSAWRPEAFGVRLTNGTFHSMPFRHATAHRLRLL